MKRSTRKKLKVFLFSVLAAGVVVFFAGVSFAGAADMGLAPADPAVGKGMDGIRKEGPSLSESSLTDAFYYAPAKGAEVGVPTAGSVGTLTASSGHVRLSADDGGKSKGQSVLAGFDMIGFEAGGRTGDETLDLAVGRDSYFEAQDFTVTPEGISLCY